MQKRWMLTGMLLAVLSVMPADAQSASSGMNDTYLETRVTDLETQLRAANGRLEQVEWQNKQLRASLERMQGDLDQRLGQLEHQTPPQAALPPVVAPSPSPQVGLMNPGMATRPPSPPPVTARPPATGNAAFNPPNPAVMVAPDADADTDMVAARDPRSVPPDRNLTADNLPGGKPVSGQLGKLYMSNGQVKGADRDSVVPTLPSKPAGYGLTASEQYDQAFQMLRESNFGGAEEAFKAFLAKNPQDKLVDNAKFWLGETYYARGKFDAAAVAFADAYQTAPKGSKAAESLFKLGMSLEGLNKSDDACTTFGEVRTQFPHAPLTVKTRVDQEVKKMKCK
jgi:tol-pal system protein YbgF